MMRIQGSRRTIVMVALLSLVPGAVLAGADWNDDGIAWLNYQDALESAKESGKPICLVFYTDWCPHCTAYSRVFHDEAVVKKSKAFVMVRLNRDEQRELSARHAPDGEYIPRTLFLSPDGRLDASLQAPRDKYKYFYDENDPASLLDGMDRALAKLK
jgi:protein-disulfide reductase (glutathione)